MKDENQSPIISYVVATYNRKDDLYECIESILEQSFNDFEIIVISNSTDGTKSLFNNGGSFDRERIRFYQYTGRMGVAEARNVGFEKAEGDIIITVDDDALFTSTDAADKVLSEFRADPNLGAIAFQSVNYHSKEIEDKKVPRLKKDGFRETPFYTSYFIGVGNAIRSCILEEIGYYPENYKYGYEEIDLSYRILNSGYYIKYCPDIQILHKESPDGRFPKKEIIHSGLKNRTETVIKYLPWRHVLVSTILWCAYYIYKARGDPRPVYYALKDICLNLNSILKNRNVVDESTLEYLKQNSGRLYF